MTRVVGGLLIALTVVAAQSLVLGAQKRAYKPAERSQQASDEQAAKSPAKDGDGATPAPTYDQELQAAKDKRDKDLEALNSDQPDRRTLEKRKQEIFSQYAAIVAALRDKYEASQPDGGTTSKPGSRYNTKAKGGRDKKAADDTVAEAKQDDRKNGKANKKKNKDADGDALAEAMEKLDEENARHASKIEELNADLRQAQSSNNVREVRKAEKAIEKENNTYSAKKAILERRVKELGGTITPPVPPKPAAKDAIQPPATTDAPPPAPAK